MERVRLTQPWYREAFGGDYHDRWVVRGATRWKSVGDTRAQVAFVVRAVRLEPGYSILDLACGHGRHSVELARLGFAVTGLDLSSELLAVARQAAADAGVDVRWLEADMRHPPPDGFDVALSMDTSFGYFSADDDNQAVLDGLHAALRPGGRLLLDVLARDAYVGDDHERSWRELPGGELLLLDHTFDSVTSRLRIEATMVDPDGSRHPRTFDIRLYSQTELRAMLLRAGFGVVQAWGGYDGSPPSARRRRLILLAERRP